MKKILAALAVAIPMFAHAEMIAYASNDAGGRIVLTQRNCPVKTPKKDPGQVAFRTNASGESAGFGCWAHMKPFYIVTWSDDTVPRFYNVESFQYTDLSKP